MPRRRPAPETLESLRVTLQKLVETDALPKDPMSISELKRVLLSRFADLELAYILETTTDAATDRAPDPVDLVPPPSTVEEDHTDGLTKGTNLD